MPSPLGVKAFGMYNEPVQSVLGVNVSPATTIRALAESRQPLLSTTINVYVVEVGGAASGLRQSLQLRLSECVQLYDRLAGSRLALSIVLSPFTIVSVGGEIVTSIETAVNSQPVNELQLFAVHRFSSSQTMGVMVHPEAGLQLSEVQASPSSQVIGVVD